MHWLRLIRWTNLLIIFLTQLLVWAFVIQPMRRYGQAQFLLDFQNFLLLSACTVLIAAAGYIINDYFDIRIDSINRPDRMVLEKKIPRRMAIIMHTVLNVIALSLAAVVARRAGHYSWLLAQTGCTVLLWFYSTHFKRRFVSGNLIVALLTALTILVLVLYEPAMHYYLGQPVFISVRGTDALSNPAWILCIYSFFAFILTWMREIVKDMEDIKGDAAEGCITMPVKLGLKGSIFFTRLLGLAAVIPLSFAAAQLLGRRDLALGGYIILALILPIIVLLLFLSREATTAHYAKASLYLKLIMLSGIGSLIIFYLKTNA